RVDRLLRLRDLIQGPRRGMAPPGVAQPSIVGDAVDKRPFRARSAKARKGPPDGKRDLLEQIVPLARARLIARSETRQGRAIFPQDAVEVLLLPGGRLRAGNVRAMHRSQRAMTILSSHSRRAVLLTQMTASPTETAAATSSPKRGPASPRITETNNICWPT